MIAITDASDPRIQAYRDVRERDLVGRASSFIAEGEVVLRHLIESRRFDTVSALLAENRSERLGPILQAARPASPIYVASQNVMDEIAGFPLHRGVLALGRWREKPDAQAVLAGLSEEALVLVVVGIGNHDNMGGLFRNAAAFGAGAVLLDATSCDPLYRKSIRVSVGAALVVPFARMRPGEDVIGTLTARGYEVVALSPHGSERLRDLQKTLKMAVIVGTEGSGLPNDMLKRCRTVRIPMADGFDSLNLATATGVVLHHLLEEGTP